MTTIIIGIVKVQMRVPSVDIQQLKEMIKLKFKIQLLLVTSLFFFLANILYKLKISENCFIMASFS